MSFTTVALIVTVMLAVLFGHATLDGMKTAKELEAEGEIGEDGLRKD